MHTGVGVQVHRGQQLTQARGVHMGVGVQAHRALKLTQTRLASQ